MSDIEPIDLQALDRARALTEEEGKLDRLLEIDDFKFVMEDKRGRRFMWRLLEKCGVFHSSYTGDNETFFKEGQRNVGLVHLALIHETCPEKYSLMLKEQREYGRRKHRGRSGD